MLEMLTPLRRHWYVGSGLPVAATDSVTVSPMPAAVAIGIADPRHPVFLAMLGLPGDPRDLDLSGGRAYVATSAGGT